jgi:hypothetical protein
MNATLVKALVALVPTCLLLFGAAIMSFRGRSLTLLLQLVGASSLVIVVLAHVCEAINVFPGMHWGLQASPGHYLDASAAFLGFVLFPTGYLFEALTKHPAKSRLSPER